MGHGLEDEVVQYPWGQMSASKLKELGFKIDFRSYPDLGHSLGQEEFMDLLVFLKKVC